MIDTIKIVSMINYKTFNKIKYFSDIKTSYNNETGQVFYTIINGHIQGAYNSSISVRVGDGVKYHFPNLYYIEIEGSYHKFIKGYNSHNGYYNILSVVIALIKIVEQSYNIILPNFKHWFLQRIDIAICFDLKNQDNVKLYINNLSQCNFPKRNMKYYEDECIYIPGSTTTLKIYNKLLEFKNNDFKNFKDTNFKLYEHVNTIQGYIRFECEIKKRKLCSLYDKKYIRVNQIFYKNLKEIWLNEFQKLLKMIESDFKLISNREDVRHRLENNFTKPIARNLYNFYTNILARGISDVRKNTDRSTYYRYIRYLKKCGIDFSQKLGINFNNTFLDFNPFKQEEIL